LLGGIEASAPHLCGDINVLRPGSHFLGEGPAVAVFRMTAWVEQRLDGESGDLYDASRP
jgi:hypothetical protein